jgi:hypothetical protein
MSTPRDALSILPRELTGGLSDDVRDAPAARGCRRSAGDIAGHRVQPGLLSHPADVDVEVVAQDLDQGSAHRVRRRLVGVHGPSQYRAAATKGDLRFRR